MTLCSGSSNNPHLSRTLIVRLRIVKRFSLEIRISNIISIKSKDWIIIVGHKGNIKLPLDRMKLKKTVGNRGVYRQKAQHRDPLVACS